MSNYIQLKNQIEKLQKEAEALRKRERIETIAYIKEAIAAYELTEEDLGLSGATRNRRGRKTGKKTAVAKSRSRPAKKVIAKPGKRSLKGRKKTATGDKRSVVAPKYKDAASGATWTGRGKQPKWLAAALKGGKKLEDFRI